jgi:hypothetical protein
MALTGTYDFNGVSVSTAIASADFIVLRGTYEMTFQASIYANQAQREALATLASYAYTIPYAPAAGDVYAQCYSYLLTLPEYAGWTVTL